MEGFDEVQELDEELALTRNLEVRSCDDCLQQELV